MKLINKLYIICFILLLFGMNIYAQKKYKLSKQWFVLTTNTTTYLDTDCVRVSNYRFNYKDTIEGVLLYHPDGLVRSAVVMNIIDKDTIYLPFPLVVEIVDLDKFKTVQIGHENINIWQAIPIDYKPNDLVKLDQKWNYHTKNYPKYLRREAAQALIKMLSYAATKGIQYRVVSAYRSIAKQRTLYINAIQKKGIHQVGTAKPAHSEHHLGTTVDLTSTNRKDLLSLSFDQTPEGKWLQEHAHEFGFIQSYTKENTKKSGYMPEPWHFRYVGL